MDNYSHPFNGRTLTPPRDRGNPSTPRDARTYSCPECTEDVTGNGPCGHCGHVPEDPRG